MSDVRSILIEGRAGPEQTLSYLHLPFEVPSGVTRIEVAYSYSDSIGSDPQLTGGNTVDLGLFDPRGIDFPSVGFRGWSGSARSSGFVSQDSATPGYMPGPIQPGTWHVLLGLYKVAQRGCDYRVEIALTIGESAANVDYPPLLPLDDTPHAQKRSANGWYRGDLHCHTVNSDGDSTPDELIAHAESLGFNYLAITDHNVLTHQIAMRKSKTPLMLIPGMEVTTYKGHWNVWGEGGWIDFRILSEDQMQQAVNTALERGYFISCNHPKPFGPDWEFPAVQGFHCIEVWNGPWQVFNPTALAYWEERLRRGERYVAVGGSDTHFLKREHRAKLGQPTTWIYCPGDPSPAALINALRAGHAFVTESPDGPQIHFKAGDAMMGDAIQRPADGQLNVNVHVMNGSGTTLQLIGASGCVFSDCVAGDDWQVRPTLHIGDTPYVRAQLISTNGTVRALTNPIYLNAASETAAVE